MAIEPTGPSSAVPQPMQVRVAGQFIKDLSFESPNVLKFITSQPEEPTLNLELNVEAQNITGDLYESALHFKAEAKSRSGLIYDLELVYAGLFEIKNAPPDALEPMLHINCPALLFPFMRRIAADLTREGGFPPLMLDPVDFASLFLKKREMLSQVTKN